MNPLEKYFRKIVHYTKLPSGTEYYTKDIIEFTEDTGEVGIRPMTAMDELMFKNPDALLNGEASKQALLSCVVGLKKPEALLNADSDALLLSIRHASYAENNEINLICPHCQHKNLYQVNLQEVVDTKAQPLEPFYTVKLNHLTVKIRPFTLQNSITTSLKQFKQNSLVRQINEETSDEARLKILSANIHELTTMNSELLIDCILSISNGDDINMDNTPENRPHITEFIRKSETSEVKKISEKLKEINQIGIDNTFTAICQSCENELTVEADFNPVNFFTGS